MNTSNLSILLQNRDFNRVLKLGNLDTSVLSNERNIDNNLIVNNDLSQCSIKETVVCV